MCDDRRTQKIRECVCGHCFISILDFVASLFKRLLTLVAVHIASDSNSLFIAVFSFDNLCACVAQKATKWYSFTETANNVMY